MVSVRKNNKETIIIQNKSFEINFIRNRPLGIYLLLNIFCIFLEELTFGIYFYTIPIIFISAFDTIKMSKKNYIKIDDYKIEIFCSKNKKILFFEKIDDIKSIVIKKEGPFRRGYSKFIYSLYICMKSNKNIEVLSSISSQELKIIKKIILEYKGKGKKDEIF